MLQYGARPDREPGISSLHHRILPDKSLDNPSEWQLYP
jgi:hypothetical protein